VVVVGASVVVVVGASVVVVVGAAVVTVVSGAAATVVSLDSSDPQAAPKRHMIMNIISKFIVLLGDMALLPEARQGSYPSLNVLLFGPAVGPIER
jgi:hypothetical protein